MAMAGLIMNVASTDTFFQPLVTRQALNASQVKLALKAIGRHSHF